MVGLQNLTLATGYSINFTLPKYIYMEPQDAIADLSSKEFRDTIEKRLELALADLKEEFGEKKFRKRVKKAGKLFEKKLKHSGSKSKQKMKSVLKEKNKKAA